MAWLLVVFIPGHQRGAITLGKREGASCCAPKAENVKTSCCAGKSDRLTRAGEPTSRDRAACAICDWMAGLIFVPAFVLDHSHAEQLYLRACAYHAQVRHLACRLTHFGRDPPTLSSASVV
ncbi:MAG: hypothetical protein QM770_18435 [Tepidisphaeraceae bacterium]